MAHLLIEEEAPQQDIERGVPAEFRENNETNENGSLNRQRTNRFPTLTVIKYGSTRLYIVAKQLI